MQYIFEKMFFLMMLIILDPAHKLAISDFENGQRKKHFLLNRSLSSFALLI